jgi:putative colanic acid biosynthesis acetyltransferase WcaF
VTGVDLTRTHDGGYAPGRSFLVRALWLIVEAAVLLNPMMTSYALKRGVLRAFGASIGYGVIIKPGVHVKYPWRLWVGDHSWIGERAWIDNMEDVRIGAHAVVSQGAYLCTGNHDWSDAAMPLAPQPLSIEEGVWVGAMACVAPGVTIRRHSVLVLGAVALTDTEEAGIYAGNPARLTKERVFTEAAQMERRQ